MVCNATRITLSISTPARVSRLLRSCVQSSAGCTLLSQSTMRPIIANSKASNTPIAAVNKVIAAI
ncbi:hypothetical protein D3C81_2216170 [compost metagenome]